MAQSGEINPNYFKLPHSSSLNCSSGSSKLFFNTTVNEAAYCNGIYYYQLYSNWVRQGNSIYYNGKVCIGLPTLITHELELVNNSSNMNVRNSLQVDGRIGINTTTPSEKVELIGRPIRFRRPIDSQYWLIDYAEVENGFRFQNSSLPYSSMIIKNEGNVFIGNTTGTGTNKLNVFGDGTYEGNITIGGLGMMQSTTANQLKMYQGTFTYSSTIAGNSCITSTTILNIPTGTFTSPPAIFMGNGGSFNGLTINIESVTSISANVRFCMIGSSSVNPIGTTFSFTAVGQ